MFKISYLAEGRERCSLRQSRSGVCNHYPCFSASGQHADRANTMRNVIMTHTEEVLFFLIKNNGNDVAHALEESPVREETSRASCTVRGEMPDT